MSKFSWKYTIFVPFITLGLFRVVSSWLFFGASESSSTDPVCGVQRSFADKPYYFGISDLACVTVDSRTHPQPTVPGTTANIRSKRAAAPSRNSFVPVHRWLYYDGYFIEWGVGKTDMLSFGHDLTYSVGQNMPFAGHKCWWNPEKKPAGYSQVSMECIYRCVRSYPRVYGYYSVAWNNCHHFANRISDVLCNYSYNTCPRWCK